MSRHPVHRLDSALTERSDDSLPVKHLARYVEMEARRRFLDPQAAPDPALVSTGWERRFTTDLNRVEEVLELYKTLGYETRAERLRQDELADDCGDCQLAALGFRTIYTRRLETVKRDKMKSEEK